jgi:hypothetical protein
LTDTGDIRQNQRLTDITMAALYEPHAPALMALYGDLENFARRQTEVLPGTPGSILERTNARGFRFYAHQYYDANGRKVEKYLAGPVGHVEADGKAKQLGETIGELNAALKNVRLLGREGFKLVDAKAFATLVALHNRALFEAGAMLVGSHAYGALLNQLGARAPQYATQDVDIARSAELVFSEPLPKSFLEVIQESGIAFAEIPQLNKRKPSTSFKEAGNSFFQVDLLVPSAADEIGTAPVPELKAHATALPYLKYLLAESQEGMVLAREGCCMVKVPAPERFALHKLLVSQLRKQRGQKSMKDVTQASVLCAILAERHPGALEQAAKSLPASARRHLKAAAPAARAQLEPHPRALEALDAVLGA